MVEVLKVFKIVIKIISPRAGVVAQRQSARLMIERSWVHIALSRRCNTRGHLSTNQLTSFKNCFYVCLEVPLWTNCFYAFNRPTISLLITGRNITIAGSPGFAGAVSDAVAFLLILMNKLNVVLAVAGIWLLAKAPAR